MSRESPPENRTEPRPDERDSQLSAMFDGELSAAECELLARRLTRDEALRAQWSRFALIGAALRSERGVPLTDRVAWRVQSAVAQESSYGDSAAADAAANLTRSSVPERAASATASGQARWMRFARPVMGASIAAGVAAVSILWLRIQDPEPALMASASNSEPIVLTPEVTRPPVAIATTQPEATTGSNGESERIYSTPAPSLQTSIAPPARFANYVVAHSEYSGPLARRMALLGIVGATDDGETESADTPAQAPGEAGVVDAP
jgi:negative regulator of sigma E activity